MDLHEKVFSLVIILTKVRQRKKRRKILPITNESFNILKTKVVQNHQVLILIKKQEDKLHCKLLNI